MPTTNFLSCFELLMPPKHASYPGNCLPDKEYLRAENQNLTSQTASPSSTGTTEMSSNNDKKESFPRCDPGPRNRTQTRGPTNSHQQNHTLVPGRTLRTVEIHKGAHSQGNHLPLEKSICCLLLHKEEEWKAEASPRLSTYECLDHQELLPTPPHSPAN